MLELLIQCIVFLNEFIFEFCLDFEEQAIYFTSIKKENTFAIGTRKLIKVIDPM